MRNSCVKPHVILPHVAPCKRRLVIKGRSFKTGQNPTAESFETDHPILDGNFKILDTCDPFDLRLLESIYIHKKKPS